MKKLIDCGLMWARPCTIAETLCYARRHLTSPQADAVRLWLEGKGFDSIAAALGLRRRSDAEGLVRGALAELRQLFPEVAI